MEKYPVPNKSRVALDGATGIPTSTDGAQLRSKLRPPSVSGIARPLSIQLSKPSTTLTSGQAGGSIDTNGNIPRPSSLPRLLKTESNVAAKIESLLAKPPPQTKMAPPVRTSSLDCKNRTIINPPPVESISPSPSNRSVASSLDSNRSTSVADSGIAACSSNTVSPTVSEKKSALSLKFGFHNKKPCGMTELKKAAVERMNCANSIQQPAITAAKLPVAKDPAYLSKIRPQPIRIPTAAPVKMVQKPVPVKTTTQSAQLTLIKNRAAQVLNRTRSNTECKSMELRPRQSVEAIVASLEQEMRHQLGPDLPPLVVNPLGDTPVVQPSTTIDVERFMAEPTTAEITYVDSESGDGQEEEDFIEDIELQLQTPSSSTSQPSPREEDGSRSHDEGHPCDEEDSAATSISDAMIDDEIADQPGLVMLGQSASVPASPMHSWRSDLFQYALPTMSLIPYPPSEEEPSDSAASYRLVRRRVASVSDIDGGLKELRTTEAGTMRAELFSGQQNGWPDTSIVIELEEYTSMANELADIKLQLVNLQTILLDTDGSSAEESPLWDLKRDLVLLREELQEKNLTIRALKNELKSAGLRSSSRNGKETAPSKASTCNVATQTDRPRSSIGVSPSDSEDVQLVSTKKKVVANLSGLPVRSSRPVRLTTLK